MSHSTSRPRIGFGQVRHRRLRPISNAFAYRTYFLMLPMRSLKHLASPALGGLAVNKKAAVSFHDSDHGDGRGADQGGALGWIEELLAHEGIHDAAGEIWLHCYPRVLGFTFKPVSFWYCHRAPEDQGGSLRAILVEVNNTFGERHCYLLENPLPGAEQVAAKVFHVSPFCQTTGHYRFRFMQTRHGAQERSIARIDYQDDEGPILQTSVSGILEPVTPAALRRAFWRYPAMTLGVVFHIHLQALGLWVRRVGLVRKPPAPKAFVTR